MLLNKLIKYLYDELNSLIHWYIEFLRFKFINSLIYNIYFYKFKYDSGYKVNWYQIYKSISKFRLLSFLRGAQ